MIHALDRPASQVTLAFILGLPMINSTAAFSAVVSISTIGLYISCEQICSWTLLCTRTGDARTQLSVACATCMHASMHELLGNRQGGCADNAWWLYCRCNPHRHPLPEQQELPAWPRVSWKLWAAQCCNRCGLGVLHHGALDAAIICNIHACVPYQPMSVHMSDSSQGIPHSTFITPYIHARR